MRLTKREKELLRRAAEFVLAGEWPWEGDGSDLADIKENRERNTLMEASQKLRTE
jgi:hypothetical protein